MAYRYDNPMKRSKRLALETAAAAGLTARDSIGSQPKTDQILWLPFKDMASLGHQANVVVEIVAPRLGLPHGDGLYDHPVVVLGPSTDHPWNPVYVLLVTSFGGLDLAVRFPGREAQHIPQFLPLGGSHPIYHESLTLEEGKSLPIQGYMDGMAIYKVKWRKLDRFEKRGLTGPGPNTEPKYRLDERSTGRLWLWLFDDYPDFFGHRT